MEKAKEVLEQGDREHVIDDLREEVEELTDKVQKLKRMNSIFGLQTGLALDMVREIGGKPGVSTEMTNDLYRVEVLLEPIEDFDDFQLKAFSELKAKLNEMTETINNNIPILLNPLEPITSKYSALREIEALMTTDRQTNQSTEASEDSNPYVLLESGLNKVKKDLNELQHVLTTETLEEKDEEVKDRVARQCGMAENNEEQLRRIRNVFGCFCQKLQEITRCENEPERVPAMLRELEQGLIFNLGRMDVYSKETEDKELDLLRMQVGKAVDILQDMNSSTRLKNQVVKELRALVPSSFSRAKEEYDNNPGPATPKTLIKFKKKNQDRKYSILSLSLEPVSFQSHTEFGDIEDDRVVQMYTSPVRKKGMTSKYVAEEKLEAERKLEEAIKKVDMLAREGDSAQAQLDVLNKEIRRNLDILLSDETSELEKAAALKRIMKAMDKADDIQKGMKFQASEQKDLGRGLNSMEKELLNLKNELKTLRKRIKIEGLLRKETRIKLKISEKLLEESEERMRQLLEKIKEAEGKDHDIGRLREILKEIEVYINGLID